MTVSTSINTIAPGMLNAYCPSERYATGGQPTAADLAALAEAGYRTILDIRAPGEPRGYDEPAAVRAAGMTYINLPVGHGPLSDETFDAVRALMRDTEAHPILVHCASGNRVGLMLMPYLILDEGKSPQQALEMALRMGLSSPQLGRLAMDYVERQQG